jgi:hypothetical protein
MTIDMKQKTNYLADVLKLKMEIKASYLAWSLGTNRTGRNRKMADFYQFCNNYFCIWERYLERIPPLLEEFGEKEGIRAIHADILCNQYKKYLDSLRGLRIPANLGQAFKILLDSTSAKKNYFCSYSTGYSHDIGYPDKQEYQFWLELYNKSMEIEELKGWQLTAV